MLRREAREQAFILLFEKSFRNDEMQEIIDLAVESRELEDDSFVSKLAIGASTYTAEIDAEIEKYSLNWKTNRISKVSLAVLRLCIYEILYESDIPTSVSINEAVELAKKYGGDDDSSFVNGILGSFAKAKDIEIEAQSQAEAEKAEVE